MIGCIARLSSLGRELMFEIKSEISTWWQRVDNCRDFYMFTKTNRLFFLGIETISQMSLSRWENVGRGMVFHSWSLTNFHVNLLLPLSYIACFPLSISHFPVEWKGLWGLREDRDTKWKKPGFLNDGMQQSWKASQLLIRRKRERKKLLLCKTTMILVFFCYSRSYID